MEYHSTDMPHVLLHGTMKQHQLVYSTSGRNTSANVTKSVIVGMLNHSSEQEMSVMVKASTVVVPSTVVKWSKTPVANVTHILRRYTVCSSYWEQQSNAILNLFSLQRWANSLGMTVVEPFVCQSELKFPPEVLNNNTLTNTLRLRDYLDIDYWNAEARKRRVASLEEWENFVLHSTKKIILVIMPFLGAGGTYANDEIKSHPQCQKALSDFFDKHGKLFHSLQFDAVRNVCFSFDHYIIPPETFNAALQIKEGEDVTVWVTEWQGVDNGRVAFTGLQRNEFGRILEGESTYLTMIKPSSRLVNDSQRYVQQVLGVDFYQYEAVVIRHKMIAKRGKEWNVRRFNICASKLEIQTKSIANKIFLATDLGKFGDRINPHRLDYDSEGKYTGNGIYLFKRYLSIVYGNKSIDNYENDFVRVTNGIVDTGYIGALQRTIALYAKHVFLVGGHSSFQKIIREHFNEQHNSDAITKLC